MSRDNSFKEYLEKKYERKFNSSEISSGQYDMDYFFFMMSKGKKDDKGKSKK